MLNRMRKYALVIQILTSYNTFKFKFLICSKAVVYEVFKYLFTYTDNY